MVTSLQFYLIATAILVPALLAVLCRSIIRAAVGLVVTMLSVALAYLWLNAELIAALQIMIYAGGIAVVVVFAIFLVSNSDQKLAEVGKAEFGEFRALKIAAAVLVLLPILLATLTEAPASISRPLPALPSVSKAIGLTLLQWERPGLLLPFELISVLLLAALVGAVTVTNRSGHRQNESDDQSTGPLA